MVVRTHAKKEIQLRAEQILLNQSDSSRFYLGEVGVIIPARNEAEQIGLTLESLIHQTKPPMRIIVVTNNCTDGGATGAIARSYPEVEVIDLVYNPFLKAGALNAGVNRLLESRKLPEFLLTMDADTIPDEDFLMNTTNTLWHRPEVGAESTVCDGKKGLGKTFSQKYLVAMQRLEYARAGFTRIRQNIHTMSGAGSMIRMQAALEVIVERGALFDERLDNLVEDFETTLAIKRLGWKCRNNYYCHVHTDLMVTLPTLMKQRIRWVRGTINELRRRGWHKETWLSIVTMIYAMVSIPVFYLWIFLASLLLLDNDPVWADFWFLLLVVGFQMITVYRLGFRMMLLAGLIIPELVFGIIRHTWIITSLVKSYFRRPIKQPYRQRRMSW